MIRNTAGAVLLVPKTDNALWGLPGGGGRPRELMTQAVVREVKEETGLDVEGTISSASTPTLVA